MWLCGWTDLWGGGSWLDDRMTCVWNWPTQPDNSKNPSCTEDNLHAVDGRQAFPAFLDPKSLSLDPFVCPKISGFPGTNPRSGAGDGIFFEPSILLQGKQDMEPWPFNDFLPKESPFQGLPLPSKIWVFSGHVQVLSGPWGGFFGILVLCSWF